MRILFLISIVAFVLCSGIMAQTAERIYEKVTPNGTELVIENGALMTGSNSTVSPMNTPAGMVWTHYDNGMLWIPRNVSVGNRGTMALGVMELNNEQIELLSIYDTDPPTPIWSDVSSIAGTDIGYYCDSADFANLHLVGFQVNNPDIMNRTPYVHCYDSSSTTPLWTWMYPNGTINAGSKVAIDRYGTVAAICVSNNNTGQLDFYFLDPATGAQIGTWVYYTNSYLRGFDLSADGSTLYFHEGSTCHILDIATLNEVFSASTGGSFDGHCISGDGTKFAFGNFSGMTVYEFDGTNWNSYTYSVGSGKYADEMDFSDDGSTIGFGVTQYSPNYGNTEAYMFDVATKTIVASVTNTSSGNYQDVCSAARISADGKYFALGRWGDDMNANPEVQILERNVGLIGSVDTDGSVFGMDIDRDCQVVVSGCKSVHANTSGNGGSMDCWNRGDEDMDFDGAPRIGGAATIRVYTQPNWYYALMLGTKDAPDGFITVPLSGTVYLDMTPPNLFMLLPTLQANNTGEGAMPVIVPNDAALIGISFYLQAVTSASGSMIYFTKDYLAVTVLP